MTSRIGRWTRIALVIGAIGFATQARADQTDPKLDDLFGQLRTADGDRAAALEGAIWHIWLDSPRPDVEALVERGVAAMAGADHDAALSAFDRVVTLAPDYAEGWNKRATVYYLMGRYDESVRDIDRVLALEPRHFGALSGLGLCEVERHHDEAALAAFQRAAAIDPALRGVQDNIVALKRQLARQKI